MKEMNEKKFPAKYTQVDLLDTQVFNLYYHQDPWNYTRPVFSPDLAALSAELALGVYNLDMEQWARAGWSDFTFQVDNKVYAVNKNIFLDNEEELDRHTQKLVEENTKTLEKAKEQIRQHSLVNQLAGAVRQREGSDTGKVALMAKGVAENRYVIAVGFMGTGARFYDWLSNFRFDSDQGVHRGFMQLTRQYMSHCKEILFPDIAKELGVNSLSLEDIIKEAASDNSRFLFWMTGHSQGGAMLQLWMYLLEQEHSVRLSNMIGYGLASPLVMMGNVSIEPAKYPVYHLLNSEDLVGVVGGQIRLGVDLLYPADDALREASYLWRNDSQAQKERALVRPWLENMVDMPTALEILLAFFVVVLEDAPEALLEMAEKVGIPFAHTKVFSQLIKNRKSDLYRLVKRGLERAYISLTGVNYQKEQIERLSGELRNVTAQIGPENTLTALNEMATFAHMLVPPNEEGTSAYLEMIKKKANPLYGSIWKTGHPPTREWALIWLKDQEAKKQ